MGKAARILSSISCTWPSKRPFVARFGSPLPTLLGLSKGLLQRKPESVPDTARRQTRLAIKVSRRGLAVARSWGLFPQARVRVAASLLLPQEEKEREGQVSALPPADKAPYKPPFSGGPSMDRGDRQRAAWALYEWAQQPYWALIATFIFTPYFAAGFVGDAARGQSLLGYAGAASGLLIAVFSPLVGASVDARGNPRAWLVGLAVPFVVASAALWFAAPGESGRVVPILLCLVVAGVSAELSGSVMNALLPLVAKPGQVGRLSGTAWALAYVGALISLFIVLLGFSLPETPMLGLSKAAHEPDRMVGPLVAVWFLLFAWPLMLTAPQAPAGETEKKPLAELWSTLRALPGKPWMLRFLIGRMLIGDGISSFIAFGGVLAAGLFGWTITQLGLYAIALSVAAGIGTFIGGRVDQRLGSKTTVLIAVAVVLFGAVGIGCVGRDSLFFLWPVAAPSPGAALFSSLPERVFLGFSLFVGLTFGPAQASLRAWMAQLAPAGESGRWFGLYALSGKATAFMAPLVIAVGTRLVGDQRIAVAVSALFMIAGAVVLARVPRQGPDTAPNVTEK